MFRSATTRRLWQRRWTGWFPRRPSLRMTRRCRGNATATSTGCSTTQRGIATWPARLSGQLWLRTARLERVRRRVRANRLVPFLMRLAAGHGGDDQVRFTTGHDLLRERAVWFLVRQILLTGKEPDEGSPAPGVMIADGAPQDRVPGL